MRMVLLILLVLQLPRQLQVAEHGGGVLPLLQGQGHHVILCEEHKQGGGSAQRAPNPAGNPPLPWSWDGTQVSPTATACPLYLVHLSLLQPVVRGGRGGPLLAQGVAEVELGVTEAAVAIHAVQALPHHPLLLQEALVRHQQVKVALGRRDGGHNQPWWVFGGGLSGVWGGTLCLIMVLKWLLRKKTPSSPSRARAVSSHSPWKVSCDAVDSRNCSATSPEGTAGPWRGWGCPVVPPETPEEGGGGFTFAHQAGVAGLFAGDDLLHQLVVAELAHGLDLLRALRGWQGKGVSSWSATAGMDPAQRGLGGKGCPKCHLLPWAGDSSAGSGSNPIQNTGKGFVGSSRPP